MNTKAFCSVLGLILSVASTSQAREGLVSSAICVAENYFVHVQLQSSKTNSTGLLASVAAYPIVSGSAKINVHADNVSREPLMAAIELIDDNYSAFVSKENATPSMVYSHTFTVGNPSGFIIKLGGKAFDLDLRDCVVR